MRLHIATYSNLTRMHEVTHVTPQYLLGIDSRSSGAASGLPTLAATARARGEVTPIVPTSGRGPATAACDWTLRYTIARPRLACRARAL